MTGDIDFDRGKLKELVLHFARESERAGDEGFGMVKLNKLLFRSDFQAFRLLGRSITGEIYVKQEFGPVARDLPIVLDELAADGRIQWRRIPRGAHLRTVPTVSANPDALPDRGRFSVEELEIIANTLRELATYGGRSASDWSHEESAGWNLARHYGDVIPYETALISTEPIPARDLERARQFVRDRGWVKGTAR